MDRLQLYSDCLYIATLEQAPAITGGTPGFTLVVAVAILPT